MDKPLEFAMPLTSRTARVRQGDQGLTIILVALCLLVLMVFAALVLDIGAAYNERRQDQSAADAAALGGAAFAGAYAKADEPLQFALDEAKRLAAVDVNRGISQTQWDQCTDAGALFWKSNHAALDLTDGSPCISFDAGFSRMRVRIPDQAVRTTFARVMGVNQINTSAVAEASILLQGGGQFPSSVYSGVGAGSRVCLSGGEKPVGVCDGPGTGTFGSFAPMYYIAIPNKANSICDSGDSNDALARVMSLGLDHALGYWSAYDLANPPTTGIRENGANCPQNPLPELPNTVVKGQGNEQGALLNGMIEGAVLPNKYGPYEGRLRRGNFKNANDSNIPQWTVNDLSKQLDNKPLWTFLVSTTGIANCNLARATGNTLANLGAAATAVNLMTQCLQDWSALPANHPSKQVIFDESVKESPRLASVPRFAETSDCGTASCRYHITGFSPVFMTTVFAERSAGGNPKPSCTHVAAGPTKSFCVHTTGLADAWSSVTKLEGLEALTIPCGALPEPICVALDPSKPGQDFGTTFVVQLLK